MKIASINTAAAVSIVIWFGGCASLGAKVSLFPVSGPLKDAKPTPVLNAVAENVVSNSGPFKLVYPDGDVCEGRWSSLAPQVASVGWGNIFSKYGAAAGITTTVQNVPGINRGEAMAVCKSGNQLSVEFLTGSGTANGVGVARDEKGNVFKLLF